LAKKEEQLPVKHKASGKVLPAAKLAYLHFLQKLTTVTYAKRT